MKIFITGVGGFLGAALARELHGQGHRVSGSVSTAERLADLPGWIEDPVVAPLAGPHPDAMAFAGCDTLVLAACDLRPGMEPINHAGTLTHSALAQKAGVGRLIFISSCSAWPDSPSPYGRAKHHLEEALRPLGCVLVRPGLVIGHGGLCGRLIRMAQQHRVIPVPGGGRGPAQVIGLDECCRCLCKICTGTVAGHEHNLVQVDPRSVVELLGAMLRQLHLRRTLVPIPIWSAICIAAACRGIGLRTPVDVGSVKAYRFNAGRMRESHLSRFAEAGECLEDLVEKSCLAAVGSRTQPAVPLPRSP